MKGTILDFLKLAAEKPELAKEMVELAGKYDFQFSDEVSDEELDGVAGGAMIASPTLTEQLRSLEQFLSRDVTLEDVALAASQNESQPGETKSATKKA
jgi:hypothetical protein